MSGADSNKKPALHTREFNLLFIAHFFFGLSFWPYVLLPVLLQELGADLLIVGIIMGAAPFSGIIVRPWVGTALDRFGRKKCLIAGGVVFLLTNFLYLGIDTIDWMVYAVRFLHGLGMGVLMATFFTLAADLSPESRQTEGIAIFGISGHLSGAIGVTLGEEIIRLGGYPTLFVVCAVFSMISVILSLKVHGPGHHHHQTASVSFVKLLIISNHKYICFLSIGLALSTLYVVWFLYNSHRDLMKNREANKNLLEALPVDQRRMLEPLGHVQLNSLTSFMEIIAPLYMVLGIGLVIAVIAMYKIV